MKKILIYFILLFVFNVGNSFQAQAGTAGILQYCFYEGRWSAIFKSEREFKNNTRWCKIVKKSEDPDFYNQIFKIAIRHRNSSGDLLWFIETARLRRVVDKHEASVAKYKKIEEDVLAKTKADEKKKKITKKKQKTKKITKKYTASGSRSVALSWEGYENLIAGTVKFEEADYKGTLSLPLPNNDGTCDGTYSLQEDGKGTWQIACTNNMGAAGTLKWTKDGAVTGTGRDHNDKKVKFTVSKKS